jgi:hypothetical protein
MATSIEEIKKLFSRTETGLKEVLTRQEFTRRNEPYKNNFFDGLERSEADLEDAVMSLQGILENSTPPTYEATERISSLIGEGQAYLADVYLLRALSLHADVRNRAVRNSRRQSSILEDDNVRALTEADTRFEKVYGMLTGNDDLATPPQLRGWHNAWLDTHVILARNETTRADLDVSRARNADGTHYDESIADKASRYYDGALTEWKLAFNVLNNTSSINDGPEVQPTQQSRTLDATTIRAEFEGVKAKAIHLAIDLLNVKKAKQYSETSL